MPTSNEDRCLPFSQRHSTVSSPHSVSFLGVTSWEGTEEEKARHVKICATIKTEKNAVFYDITP
jgi:hypothetical protein